MSRVLAALLLGALLPAPALACSCLIPSVETSFRGSDHALLGRVLGRTQVGSYFVYDVRVLRDMKDGLAAGTVIRIATPDQQVVCGDSFQLGQRYVLFADDVRVGGARRWVTTYCKNNELLTSLAADELDYLRTREVVAPSGALECADPSIQTVSCPIDPCTAAPPCSGASVCEVNTCGSCEAEHYDAWDNPLCTP